VSRLVTYCGIGLRTAFRGIRRSAGAALATVLTIGLTLWVIGVFVLVGANMRALLEGLGEQIPVVAFFAEPVGEATALEWVRRAEALEGVDAVVYVSQEAALARFRNQVGGEELLEGVEGNPLPASLEVSLGAEARAEASALRVAEALRGFEAIGDVQHGDDWLVGYTRALAVVDAIRWTLGVVLGLAALLVVSSTVRLGAYARRDEIEILALVGASRSFVRGPFWIEGFLEGMAGGVLALCLLALAFGLLRVPEGGGFEMLLGQVPPRFLDPMESLSLVAAGAFLGLIGAVLAVVGPRR